MRRGPWEKYGKVPRLSNLSMTHECKKTLIGDQLAVRQFLWFKTGSHLQIDQKQKSNSRDDSWI